MSLPAGFRSLWRNLLHRAEAEAALDDELRAYVDELTAEHRRRGLSSDDARRAALLEIGGVEQVKESVREAWMGRSIHGVWRDVLYSLRLLRNRPGFTAVAVATLALGLGGATAVFSVLDAVLFRPPPGIADPSRVVAIDRVVRGVTWAGLSYPELEELRQTAHAFSGIAAHMAARLRLRDADGSRRNIVVDFASGNLFQVLGVQASLGRLFAPDDAAPRDPQPVLVLSYRFWLSQFNGDPRVLGRTVELTGTPFTVVGVAAPTFDGAMAGQEVKAWAPLPMAATTRRIPPSSLADRKFRFFITIGRLAPGVTVASAGRELAGRGLTLVAEFGRYPEVRRSDERFFLLLGSAVALLLLLSCANVATLCLLRAASRRHELAARLALGASRVVLARQLLIEGVLIATGAAALGLGAAELFVARRLAIASQYERIAVGLDGSVLAFALTAAALTVVLVSVLPALRLGRVAPMTVLRSATTGSGRRISPAQRGLVVFQVAVSLTLVATASMIFSTFRGLLEADPGFDARNVAMAYFNPSEEGYDAKRTREVDRALEAAANATPGIVSATLGTGAPLSGRGGTTVFRDGEAPPPSATGGAAAATEPPRGVRAGIAAVEPSYFAMLDIPLRSGRVFRTDDGPNAPRVAIVSQALARRLWGSPDAVGRYLQIRHYSATAERLRVVGVVADIKHSSLWGAEQPVVYVPIVQAPPDGTFLIVRGRAGEPSEATLTRLLSDVDPNLYPDGLWTMRQLMYNWTNAQRTASTWIGVFGALAVLLSALGVYGAVGHVVRQRTRELAVRAAVGAEPWRLTTLVMREGLWLSAFGGLAGMVLLFWTQTVVRRSLDGMAGVDFRVVAGCAAALGAAMALASWLPARRVAHISPIDVLRQE